MTSLSLDSDTYGKEPINEITVRIENGKAVAGFKILNQETQEKMRFSGARCSYNVRVSRSLFCIQTCYSLSTFVVIYSQNCFVVLLRFLVQALSSLSPCTSLCDRTELDGR